YVAHWNARLAIDRLLEGEEDQHVVDRARDAVDALRTPRPERGPHVMHGADPRGLEALLEAQVEVGRVDPDEKIGTILDELRAELSPDAEDFRQVLERLDVAAHGELFHGEERACALGDHPRPRDAVELDVGHSSAHRADQRG